jgi:hypothetical protein
MSDRGVLFVLLAVAIGGCVPGEPRGVPAAAAIPPLAEQVAAVRAGRSSRIVADRPLDDAEWQSLRSLAGLRELIVNAGVADDTRAEVLATLPDIERIVLRQSPLSDEGFEVLAGCRSLRDLNVPQAACTAAGIEPLATLPNLERLRLGGPNLAGADVARAIAALPGLRSLHLIDVAIGDEGLDALANLAALRNLYLDGAGVSDAAWQRYFDARPDVHVHVDQTHHDRDPRRAHD